MSPAKVTLSPKERELVTDASFILTKNAIIAKVYTLFGQLSEVYKELSTVNSRPLPVPAAPKISKGEQYQGLPWVMLDQPRYFTREDVLAIRSFFWWGNFCSITLQLAGAPQQFYAAGIRDYFTQNPAAMQHWWIGTGEDPWQHHFDAGNYEMVNPEMLAALETRPYIKLANKISLAEWEQLPGFFTENYRMLLQLLAQDQAPSL